MAIETAGVSFSTRGFNRLDSQGVTLRDMMPNFVEFVGNALSDEEYRRAYGVDKMPLVIAYPKVALGGLFVDLAIYAYRFGRAALELSIEESQTGFRSATRHHQPIQYALERSEERTHPALQESPLSPAKALPAPKKNGDEGLLPGK